MYGLLSRDRCDLDGFEPDRAASDERAPSDPTPTVSESKSLPFNAASRACLAACMAHPYLARAEIEARQLVRLRQLVAHAYDQVPLYRKKYHDAGFSPTDLKTYVDIQKIPVITKRELIAAFPDQCVASAYRREDIFPARPSGATAQTLSIRVDHDAIVTETIQGLRQVALQSGLTYREEDVLAHVDTVPWWYSSLGDAYRTAFISNALPPATLAQRLHTLAPRVLSVRPSTLEALIPYAETFKSSLSLATTRCEYSSRAARERWSQQLGVPVLDAYTAKEATRIALEFPSGRYHVCEDAVHLDVLDPDTLQPQVKGRSGLAVVTNLLNEAMPFIRYVQGDYVTQPADPEPCDVQWSQIASIDGRL